MKVCPSCKSKDIIKFTAHSVCKLCDFTCEAECSEIALDNGAHFETKLDIWVKGEMIFRTAQEFCKFEGMI